MICINKSPPAASGAKSKRLIESSIQFPDSRTTSTGKAIRNIPDKTPPVIQTAETPRQVPDRTVCAKKSAIGLNTIPSNATIEDAIPTVVYMPPVGIDFPMPCEF